jgi:hypothetical protein
MSPFGVCPLLVSIYNVVAYVALRYRSQDASCRSRQVSGHNKKAHGKSADSS